MNYKFADIISDTKIRQRWEKVRQYFFLRESTYDMTNRCNIQCEGCYYYEGDKQFAKENSELSAWKELMQSEKARGITFVVLAGAEPSLVPERCEVCYQVIPLGAIATNGLKCIPKSINYKIHISVWGNDETSYRIRNAKNMLSRQIENYHGDDRAVFIYTFTPKNIKEVHEVAKVLVENQCKLSFNMFSSPVGYSGDLRHNSDTLKHVYYTMIDLLAAYPEHILFSHYNAIAHTHLFGLHHLYGCSYPRMNPSTDIGLGRSFRQYRADLSWDRSVACCVPDTDCNDCRHYASGSAVVTARLFRHATDPDHFKAWLDYIDTYLAVWVMGYEKGNNLCETAIEPPGYELQEDTRN
ncbi:MAG: radical SAM protein [Desulfobacterales bacterium]|nr:radical SAM protein [Desulfobacterales bacterium]